MQTKNYTPKSPLINGLQAVNCGTRMVVKHLEVEVLGSTGGFSSHPTDMIVTYIWRDGVKVSLVYGKYTKEHHGFEGNFLTVCHFKTKEALHQYWSRNYQFQSIEELPKKYRQWATELKDTYEQVFGAANE